jgi:hypothetical protein
MVFIPKTLVFLVLNFILGGANAGTRVARSTMIMNLIPNHMIGRIESFYNGLGLILRTMIIGLFTETIHVIGPLLAYFIVGCIMILSFVGIVFTSRVQHDKNKSESL